MNNEAKYSITRPFESDQIVSYIIDKLEDKNIKYSTCIITDATGSVGGDTINFSDYFLEVNSVEINKETYILLLKNIKKNKKTNINIYNADYTLIYKQLNQHVIYIDCPWGGMDYKNHKEIDIKLSDILLQDLVKQIKEYFPDVLLFAKVPLNINLKKFDSDIKETFVIYNKSKFPSFKLIYF